MAGVIVPHPGRSVEPSAELARVLSPTPRLPMGLLSTGSREVREEFCLFHEFVFLPLYLGHHRNRKEHVGKLWVRQNSRFCCQTHFLSQSTSCLCPIPTSARRSASSSFPSGSPRLSEAVAGTSLPAAWSGLPTGRSEPSLPGSGDAENSANQAPRTTGLSVSGVCPHLQLRVPPGLQPSFPLSWGLPLQQPPPTVPGSWTRECTPCSGSQCSHLSRVRFAAG